MASRQGYQRFLRKKMAEGGFPTITVGGGPSDAQIASAAGLGIDSKGKEDKRNRPLPGYASGGEVETKNKWGEIGGDPGYGQPYNRHNSHGEPHTNQYMEDEHPMSYMADGGMVSHYNDGENNPDPDHHETDPDAGDLPSYSNQHGEPDPDLDHMEQEDPDLEPHPMAHDQIHPGMYADGGMVYQHQGRYGEMDSAQMHPDMSSDKAMSKQAPGFAAGGKLGSGDRFEHLTHQLSGKGAHDPKALAAYIGRKALGKAHFQKLAAKGQAREAAGKAHGGMAGKGAFANALRKKMK